MANKIPQKTLSVIALLAILTGVFLIDAPCVSAQETLFPPGYNIIVDYELSAARITVDDTLIILRSVANNESFALNDLYVAENLPLDFVIIYSTVRIDSVPVIHDYSGPIPNQVLPDYNTYRWLLDHPDPPDSANRALAPGEILQLGYAVVCAQPGSYILPFHTVCCRGDTCGLFTTADTIAITISPGSSIGDGAGDQLPLNLNSFAYPNPFNSEVAIKVEGLPESLSPAVLSVFDITGRLILKRLYELQRGRNILRWRPESSIASGTYLYRITNAGLSTSGRITLLK